MISKNSMGVSGFVWFQGVVEDRQDPLMLGRCRVRILGFHTDNSIELPTADLPWAHPIMPITSASMSGIGATPIGPVEGTWVMGFFRDGMVAQEPVMFGTIPGINDLDRDIPMESLERSFRDPAKIYPTSDYQSEPDTNKLARPEYTETDIYIQRKEKRDTDIVTASAHKVSTVLPDVDSSRYEPVTWSEPEYRGGLTGSKYPYNQVTASECGSVTEVDSTLGEERIHEYHSSGTYREIIHDGTTSTKIVSDNYTIILGSDNVKIQGACNVTIGGDCRLLVKGSMIQEVEGDYHLTVHGNKIEKITGSSGTEISTDRSINITGADILRVDKDRELNIGGSQTAIIGEDNVVTAGGTNKSTLVTDLHFVTAGKIVILGGEGVSIGTAGAMEIATSSTLNIKSTGALDISSDGAITSTSTAMTIHNDVNVDTTLTATTDVVGGGKHLKTHTHSGVTAGGGTSGPPS